uniref:Uncharacterized protein n=1 Tax=Romanomermis culicivorax TaxID=13658 RepID=A0A915IXE9_ROMCU
MPPNRKTTQISTVVKIVHVQLLLIFPSQSIMVPDWKILPASIHQHLTGAKSGNDIHQKRQVFG